MQSLRNAHFLARLVLAWFVCAIGVAVAAPMVQPQSMELICSTGGAIKLIVKSTGAQDPTGSGEVRGHTLDCPLCATALMVPTIEIPVLFVPPSSLAHALQPVEAARIAGRVAAPLPPRGPPSFS
jgi:Protein of unknown function (DUF2946)